MLKLFLLRHAQAAGSYDVDDYQRPLTLHGIEQATLVSSSLPALNLAICSSALRTKMTLDNIERAGTDIQKTIFSDVIYNGSAGDLLNSIQTCDAQENLMIVAHNPGIHQLANLLCPDEKTKEREQLKYNYAPATLSVLECPITSWKDIQPAQNKLATLISPD